MARWEPAPAVAPAEVLDVAHLCRQRLAALSTLVRARAVSLAFEGPDELFARISRGALLSVVDNLVDNAIRYTPEGSHVEVTLPQSEDGVGLLVRDDGPGIPVDDRERVFERFVRLAHGTEVGSGLGLAIVKRVLASQSATLRFVKGLSSKGIGLLVEIPNAQLVEAK